MNVDKTEAAEAYQWPSDWQCDVHCLLQEGEGHRLTGFLHASRMNRHPWLQTLALWNTNNYIPSTSVDTSGHFLLQCISGHLREEHQGPTNAGSMFLWCLFVALQPDEGRPDGHCGNFAMWDFWQKDNSPTTYGPWWVVLLCVLRKTYFILI